ncbi:MAG: fused MFS/spermidine synthase [Verrucomicrobiota bacterium]|nr:fused MFS/spermidine synthase [Verrucomicrobiota bacterium]
MLCLGFGMGGKHIKTIGIGLLLASLGLAHAQVRLRTTSAHNQISVEDSGGYRLLRFNGSMETRMWIKNPLLGHFEYTEYFQMPLLWEPKPKRVLLMGLGGGSTVRVFQHYYPDIHMDTVELDPVVAKVAKQFFHVKETPKHKIHFQDGRQFLRLNKQLKYDAILMDAYTSNQFGTHIPFHLATKEFFTLAAEDLTKDGALVFNVIGTYDGWRADVVGSIYQTLKAVFPHVYHFPATDTRNIVMLGVKSKTPLTSTSLKNKVKVLQEARPNLPRYFGRRVGRIRAAPPPGANRAGLLTDDFAPPGGLLKSKR